MTAIPERIFAHFDLEGVEHIATALVGGDMVEIFEAHGNPQEPVEILPAMNHDTGERIFLEAENDLLQVPATYYQV